MSEDLLYSNHVLHYDSTEFSSFARALPSLSFSHHYRLNVFLGCHRSRVQFVQAGDLYYSDGDIYL
jgi:hypothetical protein